LNRKTLPSRISERYFITHTPGHNDYLVSHEVVVNDSQIAGSLPLPDGLLLPRSASRTAFLEAFEENLEHPEPVQGTGSARQWRFRSVGKNGLCWSTIIPKPDAYNNTPYWILQVPSSIIKDHSDIYSQQSLCLYAALFRIDSPLSEARVPAGPRLMKLVPLAPPKSN
jgi:hypothetical protein